MKFTRSVFIASAFLWLTIGTAEAEFIGLNIAGNQRTYALNGGYNTFETDSIDLVDDLELENPEQSSMLLILEHPIKALPNIKYRDHDLDSSNRITLDADVNLNGQAFNSGKKFTSTYDLSQNDIVLYYQLLNSRLNLDLGVDLKKFDGEVSLDGDASTSLAVDETIPLLYLSARYDLPNSGFYVGANIHTSSFDLGLSDSNAQDSTIMLGYESGTGLGVEGGFKYFSLDLDNVDRLDEDKDLEYDGLFLNGYFNF